MIRAVSKEIRHADLRWNGVARFFDEHLFAVVGDDIA
jgi:hypothetical protein